jgi:hypothetical protein
LSGYSYEFNGPAHGPFSSKKIDDHTLEFTNKRGGKVIVISSDGKSWTVIGRGTDSKGSELQH